MQRIAEHLRNECIGTGDGDLRTVPLGKANGFAYSSLAGFRICEHIAFNEEPFRILNPPFINVVCREMTRNRQACPHGAFGIGSDDADTGARRFIHNDRAADVDAQLLEFAGIKKTVAIVANTADEGS